MAISAIEITQDNKEGLVDLLAVHNPLTFIAKATYTGDAPNYLNVNVGGNTYKAIFLEDNSATERSFIFFSSEVLRSLLSALEDIVQTANTIIEIGNLVEEIEIEFADPDSAIVSATTISACHAARDFENEYGAALVDQYNNDVKKYIGAVNRLMYLYWYNDDASNIIATSLEGSELTIKFASNLSNGEIIKTSWFQQFRLTNVNCENKSSIITLTAGTDFAVGADISETIDNIIAYMESSPSTQFNCFAFSKSGNDLIFQDTSSFYNSVITSGTTASVSFVFDNKVGIYASFVISFVVSNLSDGTVVAFDYILNGVTVNTSLTAKTTVSAAFQFAIGATSTETMNNYIFALFNAYTELNDLYIDQSTNSTLRLQAEEFGVSFIDNTVSGSVLTTITAESLPGIIGGTTYAKGFIRKAIEPGVSGDYTSNLYINGNNFPHNYKVRSECDSQKVLKYVDRNGEFRFMYFNQFYERSSKPKAIGETQELIESLKTGTSDKKQIGYTNSDRLTLRAVQFDSDEIRLLKGLFNSNQVFILTGSKWVRVTVSGDNLSRLAKRKFKDTVVEVTLPKSYNITQL